MCTLPTLLCLSLLIIFSSFQALVSSSSTPIFHYVLQGTPDYLPTENGLDISELVDIKLKSNGSDNFALCFFKNTQNMYTLGIGMGFIQHLVWEANRNIPVHVGATITLGSDGNLALTDVGGRVVWQTNTSNKGVVGIKLLENGNLVLHNIMGKSIWESFDHPTDTLLPGQSIRAGPRYKLVSRASLGSSFDGPYSLMVRPNDMSMFYKTNKTKHTQNLAPYYTFSAIIQGSTLKQVQFVVDSSNEFSSSLSVNFILENGGTGAIYSLTKTRYNASLSFLRLDYDGNLRVYAYNDKASARMDMSNFWSVDFELFTRDSASSTDVHETECQLPERCGNYGLCYKDQCVACPSPGGLLGWSEQCEPPKRIGRCTNNSTSVGKGVKYYKIDGVEHFSSKYTFGEGPMVLGLCEKKCSFDCKCVGYFFHQESSKCWIAYDLKTLTKSGDSNHFGYVKISN